MASTEADARRFAALRRWVVRLVRSALRRYAGGGHEGAGASVPLPAVTIVLTNAFSMGGTVGASLNLAEYLSERRSVEIVSVFRHRDKPFFPIPAGVRLTVLQDRRDTAPAPPLARAARRRSSVLMPAGDRTYDAWSLWTDVKFARMLRSRRGILIATRPGLNLVLANTARPGSARIGQEHMHLAAHRSSLRRAIADRYPRLDVLAVLTDTDRRAYEGLLSRPTRIEVMPNAVRRLGGPAADLDARLVFSAGRFSPQKGYDLLIPAYATIAARHPDWRLRICGNGALKSQLEHLIEARGLSDVAKLDRPARDIGAEMARASIFVLSSRFEGFPLVLIEAMSKGMAVVAYDCPTGPSDVIAHGHNGLLVPAEDVAGLASSIERLIDDRDLRHTLGAGARETAKEFSLDRIGPRWESLLDEVAPRRGRG